MPHSPKLARRAFIRVVRERTRAAAEAGVDWIIHADLATDADLEAVAKAGMPTFLTAILPA